MVQCWEQLAGLGIGYKWLQASGSEVSHQPGQWDPTCTEHSSPLSKKQLEFCDISLPLCCKVWWDKTYALITAEDNSDQQPGVGRVFSPEWTWPTNWIIFCFLCSRKLVFNQFCMLHKMLNLETTILSNFPHPYSDCTQSLSQVWVFAMPMDCRLLCPWDFTGKNTGVGCHFLL